ncbi:MAG: hypothetical protein ACD_73C00720G0004 [uncultured bacterium]|nr:MAG: hypothetical protein ACD_73C00720G0004 [uncultured bacterium]
MRIGVLGAGQLGRMLALAGYPLGLNFHFYDEKPDSPAAKIAPQTTASFRDEQALAVWAESVDVITYEFENVPLATIRFLEDIKPVSPNSTILEMAQDRFFEKTFFRKLGLQTPRFKSVDNLEELESGLKEFSLPCVLKTRLLGYDGKGQFIIRGNADLVKLKQEITSFEGLILEEFVKFERELSLIAVRSKKGDKAFYPLVENHHREGILRVTLAPALQVDTGLQKRANEYLGHIMDSTDYVGVLAVEFFEKTGNLIVNEMAPRVHNSGHWTIEGAQTSQFENHLRALLGYPLGETRMRGNAAMINLIGRYPKVAQVLQIPEAHFHHYEKSEARGRKVGHVTIVADKLEDLLHRLNQFKALGESK